MAESEAIGPLRLMIGQWAVRTKTITDADPRAYAEITGDYNPLHFDDAFAAGTRFGRRVAQGGIAYVPYYLGRRNVRTAGTSSALHGERLRWDTAGIRCTRANSSSDHPTWEGSP